MDVKVKEQRIQKLPKWLQNHVANVPSAQDKKAQKRWCEQLLQDSAQSGISTPQQEELYTLLAVNPYIITYCKSWFTDKKSAFWYGALSVQPNAYALLSLEQRSDPTLIRMALKKSHSAAKALPDAIKQNRALALWCVQHQPKALLHFYQAVYEDKRLVCKVVAQLKNYTLIHQLPEHLWTKNEQWTRAMVRVYPDVFVRLPSTALAFFTKKEDMRWWCKYSSKLDMAPQSVKNSRALAQKLIEQGSVSALSNMDVSVRNNVRLMAQALAQNQMAAIAVMGAHLYGKLIGPSGIQSSPMVSALANKSALVDTLMIHGLPLLEFAQRMEKKENITQKCMQYANAYKSAAQANIIQQHVNRMQKQAAQKQAHTSEAPKPQCVNTAKVVRL